MTQAQRIAPAEEVHGTLQRVRFAQTDKPWAVFELRDAEGVPHTVVGEIAKPQDGQQLRCVGTWQTSKQYGRQFRAQRIEVLGAAPAGAAGATSALTAAKRAASALFAKYQARGGISHNERPGSQSPATSTPARTPGAKRNKAATPARATQARAASLPTRAGKQGPQRTPPRAAAAAPAPAPLGPAHVTEPPSSAPTRGPRTGGDVAQLLQEHGLNARTAHQVNEQIGERATELLYSNPYAIAAECKGVAFADVEQLARRMRVTHENPERIAAGLREALQGEHGNGHCCAVEPRLVNKTAKLLNLERTLIKAQLERVLDERRLIRDRFGKESLIYSPRMHAAEVSLAWHIKRLSKGAPPWGHIEVGPAIERAERALNTKLDSSQYAALVDMLNHKVCVLTGGPGSGKTTLVRMFLHIVLEHLSTQDIALAAPTGIASGRLSDATNEVALTIHRLLLASPGGNFARNARSPLTGRLLLIDESSMVDLQLMRSLLEATPDDCAVVFVGDVDQLASVLPGDVLNDMIRSGVVHTARLLEPHRQAKDSSIITNAYRVKRRQPLECSGDVLEDFQWIVQNDARQIQADLQRIVCQELKQAPFSFDLMHQVQILTPSHKGAVGTRALNLLLQKEINKDARESLTVDGVRFALNDRVAQLVNNRTTGVFNGEIGFITALDVERQRIEVDFRGKKVPYTREQFHHLMHAYALTVHKSQGSEFPAVVIPITMDHYMLLTWRLLYTAITRGRQRVIVIGEERALHYALSELHNDERVTGLCERLQMAA